MKARLVVRTFTLFLAAATILPASAAAQKPYEETPDDEADSMYGFGGTLLYEHALGRGTFTTFSSDEEYGSPDTEYYQHSLSIRPHYWISQKEATKMKLLFRLDMTQNLVEPFGSGATVPHDVNVALARLYYTWYDALKIDAAFLAWDFGATITFPATRADDISSKILGTGLIVSTKFAPLSWLKIQYDFAFTKNWHRYSTQVLEQEAFDVPLPTRAGGGENVAEGIMALGAQNTEWALTHILGASFALPADFTIDIAFYYYQNFGYTDFQADEYTSAYAKTGRAYSDLTWGIIEVGYAITPNLSLGLGTLTEQTPKTDDNESISFPFWDTTNGANNRQTFYFDVVGTF